MNITPKVMLIPLKKRMKLKKYWEILTPISKNEKS
jgi:hypothetical protein